MSFPDNVDCLREYTEKTVTQRTIQFLAHNLFTVKQTKVAPNPYDDKQ